jgi:hypothetical protein
METYIRVGRQRRCPERARPMITAWFQAAAPPNRCFPLTAAFPNPADRPDQTGRLSLRTAGKNTPGTFQNPMGWCEAASERILVRHTGLDLQGRRGTVAAIGWPDLDGVARQLQRPEHPIADLSP